MRAHPTIYETFARCGTLLLLLLLRAKSSSTDSREMRRVASTIYDICCRYVYHGLDMEIDYCP